MSFDKRFAVILGCIASLEDGTVYVPFQLTATGRIPSTPEIQSLMTRHAVMRPSVAPADYSELEKHIIQSSELEIARLTPPPPVVLEGEAALRVIGRPFDHCAFEHGCIQERLCGKYNRCAWGAKEFLDTARKARS